MLRMINKKQNFGKNNTQIYYLKNILKRNLNKYKNKKNNKLVKNLHYKKIYKHNNQRIKYINCNWIRQISLNNLQNIKIKPILHCSQNNNKNL